jgi:hypothetical protein
MTSAFKIAPQPGIDNHFRQFKTYHARAKGQHIGVIMLPRKLRRIGLTAHHRTNAGVFIGGDGDPDAGAADQDPASASPVRMACATALA